LQARLAGWTYRLGGWKQKSLVPSLEDLKAPAPEKPAAPAVETSGSAPAGGTTPAEPAPGAAPAIPGASPAPGTSPAAKP